MKMLMTPAPARVPKNPEEGGDDGAAGRGERAAEQVGNA